MLAYTISDASSPSATASVFASDVERIIHSPWVSRRKMAYHLARKLFAKLARERSQYLHCVPRGGLNDMLCQIQLCIDYAARFGAIVVVNGTRSGFRDQFSRYFSTLLPDPFLILSDDYLSRRMLGNSDCIPAEVRGRAYSYDPHYTHDSNFCDSLSGVRLTFDRQRRYSAKLLIHEQCGGGANGYRVLERLKFTSSIRKEVLRRLQQLPTRYACIHIRHSDVSTDYMSLIDLIAADLAGETVVVCTDSNDALAYARSRMVHSEIINLAQLPKDASGMSLHDRPGFTSMATNIDLLVDLMAIALARKFYVADPPLGYPSGFSILGRCLMERPQIICNLLGCKPKQLETPHVD